MKPALVLIDLQNDYLDAPGLQPARGAVVEAAAHLLETCRIAGVPVVHVHTTVYRESDHRMPHWKRAEKWLCVNGSAGHRCPAPLAARAGEPVIHKQFFSGFGSGDLDRRLRELGCDTLIVAGVHVHACVRATVIEAYERGYSVVVAQDAVASDDPIHAAITRRYLERRAASFVDSDRLFATLRGDRTAPEPFVHCSPDRSSLELWRSSEDDRAALAAAINATRKAGAAWKARPRSQRIEIIRNWAAKLLDAAGWLADLVVSDIGKPLVMAQAEVGRTAELLLAAAEVGAAPARINTTNLTYFRYAPLGLVAVITPYNNPVAIPVGKIGPALLFGNTVVWKPAPAASRIGQAVLEIARSAGVPDDALALCRGGRSTAIHLAESDDIDGVTVSGSASTGYGIQEICARRHVPYQGELGGNNAAIVWEDADVPAAAAAIACAAFGFAGQRCTANRRVVVAESCAPALVAEIERATAQLRWGDPRNPETRIGPLISIRKRNEIRDLVQRAESDGLHSLVPHRGQANYADLMERGAYYPPTIVLADEDETHEIVQEESFGPVLVVQRAPDFRRALEMCNGVRQGLVAAVFTSSVERRNQFLGQARAGVLKVNAATADADAVSPLGGWKASGSGPAEHGPCDREFYCRVQTVYGDIHA